MKDIVIRILFVLGIIIILVMLAIGIVKIVPKIFSSLATAGGSLSGLTNREEIIISTNTDELDSEKPFLVSWAHENKSDDSEGLYSISHNCVNDVEIEIVGSTSSKTLVCNKQFTIGTDPITVQLNPILGAENTLRDIEISVSYTERNTTIPRTEGEKTLTLRNFEGAGTLAGSTTDYQDINGAGTVEITTTDFEDEEENNDDNQNTNTTPSVSTPLPPVVSTTPADLAVSNISSINNIIIFTVTNIGGRSSGIWTFNYTLPTNPSITRSSGVNISLNPGERLQFTINLNNTDIDDGSVIIDVNADRRISESSYSNNRITAFVDSNGGGSNNNGGYNSNDDADLVITEMYVRDDDVDEDDEVILYFTIKNQGGKNTGRWEYEVSLPTDPRETFSNRESSLRPGQSREFRIEFDGLREGNNQDIRLEVDPDDDIDEENERNNDETVEIDVRD